jgi:hypothetical protein
VFLPVNTRLGNTGIQLERSPLDLGVGASKQFQSLLQASLSDVAPGTDNVGNHFDVHRAGRIASARRAAYNFVLVCHGSLV